MCNTQFYILIHFAIGIIYTREKQQNERYEITPYPNAQYNVRSFCWLCAPRVYSHKVYCNIKAVLSIKNARCFDGSVRFPPFEFILRVLLIASFERRRDAESDNWIDKEWETKKQQPSILHKHNAIYLWINSSLN